MAQYLDKEVLVEKIEKRKKQNVLTNEGAFEEDVDILCLLDTLDTKEVDLEKELDYSDYIKFFNEHPNYNNGDWGFEETWTFAQYCYKLGLKAMEEQ